MLKLVGSVVLGMIVLGCSSSSSGLKPGQEIQTNNGSSYEVYTWHDNTKNVTCWILSVNTNYGGRGGISCLYDK